MTKEEIIKLIESKRNAYKATKEEYESLIIGSRKAKKNKNFVTLSKRFSWIENCMEDLLQEITEKDNQDIKNNKEKK